MSEMKKTFNITAFNAKGKIVLGEIPTGYYLATEEAVSKIEPKGELRLMFIEQ